MQKTAQRFAFAIIAILSFSLVIQPVAAQPSPEQLLTRLDGIQTAYARKYIADRELGFATPVLANPSTPDILLITVLEFDSEANATSAFDGMLNGFVAKMIIGDPKLELERSELEGPGDQATLFTGASDHADGPEQKALLAVRDGNLGFLITAHGGDASTPAIMQDIAASMADASPGGTPVSIVDGLATGSTFDIMPGHDAYDEYGLAPMYDYDLMAPDGGQHPLEDAVHDHATPATQGRD